MRYFDFIITEEELGKNSEFYSSQMMLGNNVILQTLDSNGNIKHMKIKHPSTLIS